MSCFRLNEACFAYIIYIKCLSQTSWMESFQRCETRPWEREPSGQRMSFPIGCFLSLIGRKWLLIGCCRSLAFEASATRAPPAVLAHTRTAEEEGTDRGASWNPGGKTVKWPNDPRNQKRQQVFIRISDQTRWIHDCCFDKDIKTVHFTAATGSFWIKLW